MSRFPSLQTISVIALLVLAGCSEQHEAQKNAQTAAVVVKGATIEVVKSGSMPETLDVVGTVRARTSAIVSARIPGMVSVLKVREGDRVRKGQLLAQLEAQENMATAAAATAGSKEAERALDEAVARKRLSDRTFERYSRLFSEQAVTRQEFEIKQTEKELAAQGVARAEASLNQSRQGSRAASAIAGYTRIIAPVSGVITSKQIDLGTSVFPAQPLMTIEEEGNYQLELAVPESLTMKIKPGAAVLVTLDALKTAFKAKIAEIVPSADPASRTFVVKVNLDRKGLRSGMFGRGAISLGTDHTGITVPVNAVVERGALTFVWVVDKDNVARMRLLKTGKQVDNRMEILAGLADGERIVTSGAEKVSEGAKVE